ncbi:prenylcysteine oxidase 1, isoform CRA_c [Mus musculus]|nr:prenylcysteine oxidase 1, isoform CRA_c [Mus musculus]
MGRFAAALVGSLFWLGLLLCGLGSLASAEPRAPPNRIGSTVTSPMTMPLAV